MRLSRESGYGIDGLVALAEQPAGTVLLLTEIATAQQLPQSFLAKIFQKLARHGIVRSFRGAVRGYALAQRPEHISLKAVLLAIEGPELFERCVLWSDRCASRNPCRLHAQWVEVVRDVHEPLLMRTTLADVLASKPHQRKRPRRKQALGKR